MIGVISDDLTGAAELGAVGLRYGLPAEIVARDGAIGSAELVCMDTNSRSCPAEEAARRTIEAARLLKTSGAQWIYKKVDSVLRGNVIAEVEAAMHEFGFDRGLLVPENPLLGRIIRDGRYYVRGKAIDQTEFSNDPEHPRKTASVLELLGRSNSFSVAVSRLPGNQPARSIIVGEAATPADLQSWAARADQSILAAGGAEFFAALLAARGHKAATAAATGAPSTALVPELFICGSASASTCDFASEAKQKGTPLFSFPEHLARGEQFTDADRSALLENVATALQSHQRVILSIGLPVAADKTRATELLGHLSQLAAEILRRAPVAHVYAEGGSTAADLLSRMGWKRLKVLREEARGVVTLAPEGTDLLLTMKPGSYIWPTAIKTAI